MKKSFIVMFVLGIVALVAASGGSQPPPGEGEKKQKKDKKGPPPFVLGKVLPPFVRDALELTDEQEKAINDLEKEVRAKLLKILTEQQIERLKEIKGPKGKDPQKGKDDQKGKDPPPESQAQGTAPAAGIQWFATWTSGLAEARRTGKPILLVSAAPHCAGVSGIW